MRLWLLVCLYSLSLPSLSLTITEDCKCSIYSQLTDYRDKLIQFLLNRDIEIENPLRVRANSRFWEGKIRKEEQGETIQRKFRGEEEKNSISLCLP